MEAVSLNNVRREVRRLTVLLHGESNCGDDLHVEYDALESLTEEARRKVKQLIETYHAMFPKESFDVADFVAYLHYHRHLLVTRQTQKRTATQRMPHSPNPTIADSTASGITRTDRLPPVIRSIEIETKHLSMADLAQKVVAQRKQQQQQQLNADDESAANGVGRSDTRHRLKPVQRWSRGSESAAAEDSTNGMEKVLIKSPMKVNRKPRGKEEKVNPWVTRSADLKFLSNVTPESLLRRSIGLNQGARDGELLDLAQSLPSMPFQSGTPLERGHSMCSSHHHSAKTAVASRLGDIEDGEDEEDEVESDELHEVIIYPKIHSDAYRKALTMYRAERPKQLSDHWLSLSRPFVTSYFSHTPACFAGNGCVCLSEPPSSDHPSKKKSSFRSLTKPNHLIQFYPPSWQKASRHKKVRFIRTKDTTEHH